MHSQTTSTRIAVLELSNPAGLTAQEAAYVTDLVRWAGVGATEAVVLTRENMLELLPPGVDLTACEGQCEVETGRNLGVERVISGEIVRYADGLRVLLKAHDTETARLIGVERASAKDTEGLEGAVDTAAKRLFEQLGTSGKTPADISMVGSERAPSVDPYGFLTIESSPAGAEVIIDGVRRGRTPLLLEDPVGAHTIEVRKDRHHTYTAQIRLGSEGERIDVVLELALGRLDVDSRPHGARVYVDGVQVGTTPMQLDDLQPGAHLVKIEARCHTPWQQRVVVSDGESREVFAELEEACSQRKRVVSVMAFETDGRPCHGPVFIDGEAVGHAPWKGPLNALAHEVQVPCETGMAQGEAIAGGDARLALRLTAQPGPTVVHRRRQRRRRGHTFHGHRFHHPPSRHMIDEVPGPSRESRTRGTTRGSAQRANVRGPQKARDPELPVVGFGMRMDRARDVYGELTLWVNGVRPGVPRLGLLLGLGVHRLEASPVGFHDHAVTFGGGLAFALPMADWVQVFTSAGAYGGFVECDRWSRTRYRGRSVPNEALCQAQTPADRQGNYNIGVGLWALRGGMQFLPADDLSIDFGLSRTSAFKGLHDGVKIGEGDGFTLGFSYLF
ncbi:MAG: PEGA domain-containing protein [Bradymonadia bacterium]